MLRLGLIGDTQGRYKVAALLDKVLPHFRDVDEVWHIGDWQEEAVLDGLRALGRPMTVVNGNAPDDPRYSERVVRRLEGLEVGMVHRPPKTGDAWAAQLDLCIHGHTHRWRDETRGRTRFINVGTPTVPGPGQARTIAILEIDGREARLRKIVL